MTDAGLRTSALADAAGVNIQTLRYYERRGLLLAPRRSLGGHRLYPEEAVTTVRVIKAAQRLGFTLTEVADLLRACGHGDDVARDGQLRQRAVAKLAELDRKISDLQTVRTELAGAMAAADEGRGHCSCSPNCPLPLAGLVGTDHPITKSAART